MGTDLTIPAALPDWTLEDYQTTTPFDWLYQYKDNKFVLAQLREKIKVHAGEVGVKNFVTLWKAYLETQNKNNYILNDRTTDCSDQPVELYCGEYTCDDYGISCIDRFGGENIVCRHPIMPIRRLSNIDTGEIRLEIAFSRGGFWRTLIVEKAVLASSQKILDMAKFGVAVDSENAKDLVQFITFIENENYDKLGETRSVGRLGWIKNCGFSPYVEGVVFDGDLAFAQMFDAVKKRGSYKNWLDLAKDIRGTGTIARIQLAASFASCLVEPLGCLPFFLHTWGGSGSGKTVGLMFAASVWANPALGEFIRTFNSTTVGHELLAGFVNSMPLFLDELQIVKDQSSFDRVIYMLTEGIGRSRGARSGGLQKVQTWKNCILTTGEMPITNASSGSGAVNRIIEIDVEDEVLFEDPRNVAETVRQNYGFAGKIFVENLTENLDEARETYQEFYSALIKGDTSEKQAMSAALILTADKLSEKWIFKDEKTLKIEDIEKYLSSVASIDQNSRALDWIYEFVAANNNRFDVTDNRGEIWGEISDGYIYIIKSIFDSKMREAGFNAASFLSWAKRRGIIRCNEGRNSLVKRIAGTNSTIRTVCIQQNEPQQIDKFDELPF